MNNLNKETKINTQIDPIVPFNKYSHDIIEEYELSDLKTPWVAEILKELHEELDPEDQYPAGSFLLNLVISRKKNTFIGDHIVVRSTINAKYHLPCGISLKPLPQNMQHQVSAAFLHENYEKQPEFEESTTVFADNEEMELYFYRKGMVDIKEFIHEQVFLEVPAFPRSPEFDSE